MNSRSNFESFDTIIIGAGQTGLSVGYYLARRGLEFVILEGNERVGDSWRRRWDSLRLFTPTLFDSLPGMRFPASSYYFPTKDEMADYLEGYAAHFDLPVRTGARVERLWREGERFRAIAGANTFEANQVVVAMADHQKPRVPAFARELNPEIVQLHSHAYRNPSQLKPGKVLIAGAGNSGAEVAFELAPLHETYLAGRNVGQLPFKTSGWAARHGLIHLVLKVVFHRILTVDTPIGRKLRPKLIAGSGPLIRTKSEDLEAARVTRLLSRVSGVRNGLPELADGTVLDVENLVWCTGFCPGFSWIDLPGMSDEAPQHDRGVIAAQPGLYFAGLHFLYSLSSEMVHASARNGLHAARLVEANSRSVARDGAPIRSRTRSTPAVPAAGGVEGPKG